jgi:hypothetical protein
MNVKDLAMQDSRFSGSTDHQTGFAGELKKFEDSKENAHKTLLRTITTF